MDDKTLIAKRVALEVKHGALVNLGIGLPTLVAAFLPKDIEAFFQSENGIVGMLALPEEGLEAEDLTDGGSPTDVIQAPNDKGQVEPMLEKIEALPEELGKVENLLADTGYFSADNVEACGKAGVVPVIAMAVSRTAFR